MTGSRGRSVALWPTPRSGMARTAWPNRSHSPGVGSPAVTDLAGSGVHLAPGEGDELRNPLGGPLTILARGDATGGSLTAFESSPAAGEGPPLHAHPDEDELIHFVSGHFRVKLGGALHDAPAGSVTFIPKGLPHSWQNVGDAMGRLFIVFTPAATGMETFFERFAEFEPDAAAEGFTKLAADARMEILGPPLARSDPLR